MEQLPGFGREVGPLLKPTYAAYTPLLQKQSSKIKSTNVTTFQYGPHERHKLDIYTPASGRKSDSILIFLYGGGFMQGDRIISDVPDGLVYANLGHYFAENAKCPVAILDYRLISHGAGYPSGGEDLSKAIEWLNQRHGTTSTTPLCVYLMGNSAGGLCIAEYLLAPELEETRERSLHNGSHTAATLAGAIFLSVPLSFKDGSPTKKVSTKYYGTKIDSGTPLELFKAAKQNGSIGRIAELPLLVLPASLDTDDVLRSNEEFMKHADGLKVELWKMEGHNHISAPLGLGTDIAAEEAWGRRVIDFMDSS